jgi:hypothetical protein
MTDTLQCVRSPEKTKELVAARKVESEPRYAPNHPAPGTTWCNLYVQGLLEDLEVPFPTPGWFAHQQIDWLASDAGEAAGWSECSSGEAVAFANKGYPVIVTYRNSKNPPEGHSHIGLVVPSESTLRPHITQAGAHNYLDAPLEKGFGNLPVRFFWHL